jgi:hypothetical protein
MGKRSLRKVFDKKLAERRKLNPDMQKLLLSFDAEYGHPERGNAPAPRGKADRGEGASSQ